MQSALFLQQNSSALIVSRPFLSQPITQRYPSSVFTGFFCFDYLCRLIFQYLPLKDRYFVVSVSAIKLENTGVIKMSDKVHRDDDHPIFYGTWMHYSWCRLERDDGEEGISLEIIKQILRATGYSSINEFNESLSKYELGNVPSSIQKKFHTIFEGYNKTLGSSVFPKTLDVDGVGTLPLPLHKIDRTTPCSFEIYAISIQHTDDEMYDIPIKAGVACAKVFTPKPGQERLCSLLMSDETDYSILSKSDQDIIAEWVSSGDEKIEDLETAYESANISLRDIPEHMGIGTIEFDCEDGGIVSLFLSGEEEKGFSVFD